MANLAASLANDRLLKEELLRAFPELEDDERTLIDTLDGISDLDDQIVAAMRLAVEREAMAEGLLGLIDKIGARQRRLLTGATKIRSIVLNAMLEAGRKTIKAADMTLTANQGKAGVQIVDEALVPDRFWNVTKAVSLEGVGNAIRSGQDVPGATLKNPRPYLTVRQS